MTNNITLEIKEKRVTFDSTSRVYIIPNNNTGKKVQQRIKNVKPRLHNTRRFGMQFVR
jgi:hypothetical protein